MESSPVTPCPAPPPPPPPPSPSSPPLDLSQWLASLLTPATTVLWWPATLRALDLLDPPHSPHCKTVSLSDDFFFHHTQFSDQFFQLRLSGLLTTCPEELVSHPSHYVCLMLSYINHFSEVRQIFETGGDYCCSSGGAENEVCRV